MSTYSRRLSCSGHDDYANVQQVNVVVLVLFDLVLLSQIFSLVGLTHINDDPNSSNDPTHFRLSNAFGG